MTSVQNIYFALRNNNNRFCQLSRASLLENVIMQVREAVWQIYVVNTFPRLQNNLRVGTKGQDA